jgi:hypothetical protein
MARVIPQQVVLLWYFFDALTVNPTVRAFNLKSQEQFLAGKGGFMVVQKGKVRAFLVRQDGKEIEIKRGENPINRERFAREMAKDVMRRRSVSAFVKFLGESRH